MTRETADKDLEPTVTSPRSREMAALEIVQILSRDIDFYRKRSGEIVLLFGGVAMAITFLALSQGTSNLGKAVLAALLLFGVRPVIRVVRASTARGKYVKLVRQELLGQVGLPPEYAQDISPITLGRRLNSEKEEAAQKTVPSVTSQYVHLVWTIGLSAVVILLDSWAQLLLQQRVLDLW